MLGFTLCSNNYFAQACVLAKSFLNNHPTSSFVIGLVDKPHDAIDYNVCDNCRILPVQDLAIPNFQELVGKYTITEINTTVKPFYFTYLFQTSGSDKIIYLDPDIFVYSFFSELYSLLDTYNIIITPQSTRPIDDGDAPADIHLLGSGVFNLGFIALSQYGKVEEFLNWWSQRLIKYGYGRPSEHMFFDQLWINLVPAFFDNYYILKHPGYNAAAWNMHERQITHYSINEILVNTTFNLRFWHFSGFDFNNPTIFCSYSRRFSFEIRRHEAELFKSYDSEVRLNGYEQFSRLIPMYKFSTKNVASKKIGAMALMKSYLKRILNR